MSLSVGLFLLPWLCLTCTCTHCHTHTFKFSESSYFGNLIHFLFNIFSLPPSPSCSTFSSLPPSFPPSPYSRDHHQILVAPEDTRQPFLFLLDSHECRLSCIINFNGLLALLMFSLLPTSVIN